MSPPHFLDAFQVRGVTLETRVVDALAFFFSNAAFFFHQDLQRPLLFPANFKVRHVRFPHSLACFTKKKNSTKIMKNAKIPWFPHSATLFGTTVRAYSRVCSSPDLDSTSVRSGVRRRVRSACGTAKKKKLKMKHFANQRTHRIRRRGDGRASKFIAGPKTAGELISLW